MTMLADFAVFILTHGRPDTVLTYRTLRDGGYTGPVYLVVDNEDTARARYEQQYPGHVLVFDKAAIAEQFDEGDNFQDRRAVIYARNACFALARALGVTYFLELDDDYRGFFYRFNACGQALDVTAASLVKNLDRVFASVLTYYQAIPALALAFMQTGDLLGGLQSTTSTAMRVHRKAMNTFFCSTERPFFFVGRINEDVNTYTWYQSLGHLFLSINNIVIQQHTTQQNPGGMTELYRESGTYIKSFYTVMYQPSSVHVSVMPSRLRRLHHKINWPCTVPCILAESHRRSPQEA
jgi:hypothetical protein